MTIDKLLSELDALLTSEWYLQSLKILAMNARG